MLSERPAREAIAAPSATRTLTRALAWRQGLLIPLSIALISRLMTLVGADLLMAFALKGRHYALPFTGPIDVWQRKDALWYVAIARDGYINTPQLPYVHLRANFFPLYPLLIHVTEPLFALFPVANPYALAGMVISWVTFAVACVGLYRLTSERFGQGVAIGAVLLLAVFPFSLYYGAAYTESLYFVLAVWAFVAIERRNWWLAGALAGVACAVRPPGLLIGACVGLAYLLDWYRTRHPLHFDILALALTPLGILAYIGYCWVSWGEPLAYVKASRSVWHGGYLQTGGLRFIAHALRHSLSWLGTRDGGHILDYFAIILMLGFLALVPVVWRLLGPIYALFALASIAAPILDFPNVNSLGRYLSVVFPVFIVAAFALRGRPRLLGALAIVSAILLILFATYFVAGYGLS